MSHRQLTLAIALLLSAVVHVLLLAGDAIGLPDFNPDWDDVVATRRPPHVQRIYLATRRQAMPLTKRKETDTGRTAPRRPAISPHPMASVATGEPVATEAVAADSPGTSTPDVDSPPAAIPVTSRPEPAPAFPVELSADLEAHVSGLSATLHQRWNMEGFRYAIDVKGSKFGFKAQLTSEGRVTPEGGLSPERSQTILGGKLQSLTEYGNGTVRYGKPTSLQAAPLPFAPQDFASVPFHLAVTFNGQPQTVFVSTGRHVYQTRFTLVAEEMLRLPGGILRTYHLSGEQFDEGLRQMVQSFDIWLAPDYLNYPVKVSGHLSGGEPIEYRVIWLEIEGKPVFGSNSGAEISAAGESVPAWLQERVTQGNLNNP